VALVGEAGGGGSLGDPGWLQACGGVRVRFADTRADSPGPGSAAGSPRRTRIGSGCAPCGCSSSGSSKGLAGCARAQPDPEVGPATASGAAAALSRPGRRQADGRRRASTDPRDQLVVEVLARTGMRTGELVDLDADAVVQIGAKRTGSGPVWSTLMIRTACPRSVLTVTASGTSANAAARHVTPRDHSTARPTRVHRPT
jgi:hypothetical protein